MELLRKTYRWPISTGRNSGKKERWESSDAEVAILLPDGKFYRIQEHDDVIGRQTAEDVAKWIEVARNL